MREGNEVCPPTDELTPIPGPPPPECPDAGPEVCGEDTPHLQIQMPMPTMGMGMVMVIVMAMGMGMGMEKMGRAETETMEGILTMGTEEHLMVAAHSLIDVNDRENFLLDIIAVDYL